ncbi:CDP-glucose 4,6-dehydratase [Akkermansiaceae bacterium]|nr:CDP-glucose 4,6-dehydratase [Akkermansiaceae bacterium]MDC0311104.1 CDP-glucose 4,6-dehydratase [Akkermansiaceae bacterium]
MNFQNTFKNRRILVTGDTGFKGSWLCEWLLAEGAEVYGLGLAPNTKPALFDQLNLANRIHHNQLDIRDAKALRDYVAQVDPEIVFHLAAQPLVRLSYEIPVETYATNVMGTVHLLDAIRQLQCSPSAIRHPLSVVCVTTDKCYENKEWLHGYREEDPMGGHDPYSSSKGACEIAIQSFRKSYFNDPQSCGVAVASARAGNVIGGGDWALDRIIPDCVRALQNGESIPVRNKVATRPWQHVLEPLGGYMLLAAELWRGLNNQTPLQANFSYDNLCGAFNFGPELASNRSVDALVKEVLKFWPGEWEDRSNPNAHHEASLLNLAIDKAHHMLNWKPRWDFEKTIQQTIDWYHTAQSADCNMQAFTQNQIKAYQL